MRLPRYHISLFFVLDGQVVVHKHVFVREFTPWYSLRGSPIVCCMLLSALFLSDGHAQDSLSAAQKKYQKEVSALFRDIDLVDLKLVKVVVGPTDELAPSVKLRNRTDRELPVPFAIGFPSERGGVLGLPVWRFERIDKKTFPVVTRKGALVYARSLGPSGFHLVDVAGQKAMTAGDMSLPPGDYQLTVLFVPVANYVHESLVSKPIRFKVVAAGAKSAAVSDVTPSKGADAGVRKITKNAKGEVTLKDCVRLENLELSNVTVKSGTPLAMGFRLARLPEKVSPREIYERTGRGLNCIWVICKTNGSKNPKARVKISGSTIGVGGKAIGSLDEEGVHMFTLIAETKGLEPGSYEVVVFLRSEGESAQLADSGELIASFKIIR